MAAVEFNEKIKFILPSGFIFSRDEDDEGNEVVSISAGEYENEEGETCYKFNCRVIYNEYDSEEADEELTSEHLIEFLAERMENSRLIKLPGKPKTILLNRGMPLSLFGRVMKMYASIGLVQISDWSVLQLIASGMYNDDEPSENTARYENLYEVLKATRINGKKLPIDKITPHEIEESLQLTFDEDGEAIDISPKVHFNIITGDETTTYEYTAEGMKEVGKESLKRVVPNEALYPHFNSIRFAGGLGFLGVNVVVNASGTEYSFVPLRNLAEDCDTEESMKNLFNRVIAKDTENYDLDQKAKEMQKLFHVNESAFDPCHDRECELEWGYLHRAYMMSGLRSFAWTLADYCKQHSCTPNDIDLGVASRIANFVADKEWLNYDDTTHCQGLCSGSDLHVFFIPDGVSQADIKKLLPSKEDIERVKQMKEKFPTYDEILSEVHSLNALRKDLAYIYPAVKVMWDNLQIDRDYDEALLGNEADIIYAWCALALAAKEPFFSEDGPVSCYFCQPIDEEVQKAKREDEKVERAEEAAKEWMSKYEKIDVPKVFSTQGTKLIKYTGQAWRVDIPEGIKTIGKGAFKGNNTAREIRVREGVKSIEANAFANLNEHCEIYIAQSVTDISELAFGENPANKDFAGEYKTYWSGVRQGLTIHAVKGSVAYNVAKSLEMILEECRPSAVAMKKSRDKGELKETGDVSETSKLYFDKFKKVGTPKSKRKLLEKNAARSQDENALGCDVMLVNLYDFARKTDSNLAEKIKIIDDYYEERDQIDLQELINAAEHCAQLFISDEFNPKNDRYAEIHNGYLKHVAMLHRFLSFVYIASEYCKKKKRVELTLDEIIAISDFIDSCGGTNYKGGGSIPFLRFDETGHYFYVSEIGRYFIDKSGIGIIPEYNYTEDIHVLRSLLTDFIKPMSDIYEYLEEKQIKRGTLADILSVWCTYCIASIAPFAVLEGIKDYDLNPCDGGTSIPESLSSLVTVTDGLAYYDDALLEYTGTDRILRFPEGITVTPDGKYGEMAWIKNGVTEKIVLPSSIEVYPGKTRYVIPEQISILEFTSKNLVIEDGVDSPYAQQLSLSELILPEGTTSIGSQAFKHLYGYKNGIVKVIIPASVKSMKEDSFSYYNTELIVYRDSVAERVLKKHNETATYGKFSYTVEYTEAQKEKMKLEEEEKERLHQELIEKRRAEEERINAERRAEIERTLAERKVEEERIKAEEIRIKVLRRVEYEELLKEKEVLLRTIAENSGIFGEKARRRKEAKVRLDMVESKIKEFSENNE